MSTPTRPRRIVRRAAMALAGVVLLISWYVGTYLGMLWLILNGSIAPTTFDTLNRTMYAPVESYIDSGYPGSDLANHWRHVLVRNAEMRAFKARMVAPRSLPRQSNSKR